MIFIDECEACQRCLSCGRRWCPNEDPSPGEGDGLCPDCYELEDVS